MKPTTVALALVMATSTLGSTPLLAAAKGSDEAKPWNSASPTVQTPKTLAP